MKTREGFVSNSSSTSFIVRAGAYPNLFSLAQDMILCRFRTDYSEDGKHEKKIFWKDNGELIDKIEKAKTKMNPDMGISFPTSNYDTYIMKVGGYYAVQTCNNHQWIGYNGEKDPINGIVQDDDTYPKDFIKEAARIGILPYSLDNGDIDPITGEIRNGNCYSGSVYEELQDHISWVGPFWYPKYDVIGKTPAAAHARFSKVNYRDVCKKINGKDHFLDYLIEKIDGYIFCAKCIDEEKK